MDAKTMQQVRTELVHRRKELQAKLNRTVVTIRQGEERMADFVDQATAEQDWSVQLTMRCREREQIQAIEQAIRRIDEGRFGVCCHCGRAISPKRLRLAPLSRLCTACKEKSELCSGSNVQAHAIGMAYYAY